MLMRYLTVYYHRCGRDKEAGLQSDRIYVLTRLENKSEIFIHRIISGDKQSFTVLTYQRTNKPGSVLG